jgi:RNA polymerase sigma factor (sigma-70 family)
MKVTLDDEDPPERLDEVISALQTGSPDAMSKVLEKVHPDLCRAAEYQIGPQLRATLEPADAVQEAEGKLVRDIRSFRGGTWRAFREWALAILTNTVRAVARRGKNERGGVSLDWVNEEGVRLDPASSSTSPTGRARRNELRKVVLAAIERLPERERQVVIWRQFQELTFREIGAKLGVSDPMAHKVWTKALEMLRAELGPFSDL